jgi:hypothetical protein
MSTGSVASPPSRSKAASVGALSSLYILGGVSGVAPPLTVYSDFWRYVPTSNTWFELSPTGSPESGGLVPFARYGHAMIDIYVTSPDRTGQVQYDYRGYMFGGIGSSGVLLNDLWVYDFSHNMWTALMPVFSGQMWPGARAYHQVNVFVTLADTDVVSKFQAWTQQAHTLALNKLRVVPTSKYACTGTCNSSYPQGDYFRKVEQYFSHGLSRAQHVRPGMVLSYFGLQGGATATDGVLGDLWIFCPMTRSWHVPAGYNAQYLDPASVRHSHAMRIVGDVMVLQDGTNGQSLLTASPSIMRFVLNKDPRFSFPEYAAYAYDPHSLSDASSNAYYGGFPPSPQNLSVAQLISLGPVVFNAPTNPSFIFTEGANFQPYIPSGSVIPNFPSNSSWSVLGQAVGLRVSALGDSFYFSSGQSVISASVNEPMYKASASNCRVIRSQLSPVCTTTTQVCLDPADASTCSLRQIASPTTFDVCFLCGKGTYFHTTNGTCKFCPRGTFSANLGYVNHCTPCPSGFFRSGVGGRSASSCTPCAVGSYQPNTGAQSCLPCPSNFACPAGAAMPIDPSELEGSALISSQPLKLDRVAAAARGGALTSSILSVCGAGIFIVLLLAWLRHSVPSCKKRLSLRSVDFLFSAHHQPVTRPWNSRLSPHDRWRMLLLRAWKTTLGGIFSLIFIFVALLVAALLVNPVIYDNTMETRSLVPVLDVPSDVLQAMTLELSLSMTLNGYSDNCAANTVQSGSWGPCRFVCVSQVCEGGGRGGGGEILLVVCGSSQHTATARLSISVSGGR